VHIVICLALVFVLAAGLIVKADEWGKLEKNLRRAVIARNGDRIKDALLPIVTLGGKKAAKVIYGVLKQVNQSENLIYWQLINALTTLTDEDAMNVLAEIIVKGKKHSVSRDILFALQNIKCASIYPLLRRVIAEAAPDIQQMAIEHLVNMNENDGIDILVYAAGKVRNKAVKRSIIDALGMMTGATPGDTAKDWEKWWTVVKDQGGIEHLTGKDRNRGRTGTAIDDLGKYRGHKTYGPEGKKGIKVLVIYAECKEGGRDHHICFDHIEDVTRRMNIETDTVERKEFERPDYKIKDEYTAVIVNCCQIKTHCVCPMCKPGKTKSDRMFP
jgi:hypothetical protein